MASVEDRLYPFLKFYMESPQWFKSLVGSAYGRLPETVKHGRRYRDYYEEALLTDPEVLRRRVHEKLRETLRVALETVPAYEPYRELAQDLDRPADVLIKLPLKAKDDLRADPDGHLSTAEGPGRRIKMFTGGSLAVPMQFYVERDKSRPKEAAYFAAYESRIPHSRQEVALYLRGRNIPGILQREDAWSMYDPTRRFLILSSDHLKPEYMPRYVEEIRRYRPTLIKSFPSALYPLAKWLDTNPDPEITGRIKGVFLSSENVYDYQYKVFRRVFDGPILNHYGLSERTLLSASMPDDDRQFFWPLYGHLEIVDRRGNPLTEPGQVGEIVGTSFDNNVMPFVRYRTNDFAVVSGRSGHPKLPGYPFLERIEGRLQEFLVTKDERLISICTMGAAHFDQLVDVDEMQYEQSEPGRVVCKLRAAHVIPPKILQEIAHSVREKTQQGCEVEVVQVEEIPRTERGKKQMLVQNLDMSRYYGAVE